jgi:hypothetical protein
MQPLSHAGRSLLNRRDFFAHAATGLSGIALASLCAANTPARGLRAPHFEPKAKRVLHVFCSGACSHLDTWDYKPQLIKRDGQPLPGVDKLVTFQGENGNLARSPYSFKPHGKSGKHVSSLIPRLAELVDEMCFVHSMTAKASSHGPAESQMNTGYVLEGFPSAGAWVSYALGSENQDLPAYVAIPDPRGVPQIGPLNWGSGFLPAVYQGTAFTAEKPIPNLKSARAIDPRTEAAARDFLALLNDEHLKRNPEDASLAARIAAYELAGRLQLKAAEVADLAAESKATHALYGTDDTNPLIAGFARNCLLARRLLERNVRIVQLFNGAYAMGEGVGNWDGHKQLKKDYDRHGPILDRPLAGLLTDLKSRGLLRDTLVVWSTEFGRMPTFQKGVQGRDHNPKGFTVWFAGAGVKKGFSHGATDEFGHRAVDKVATIYDFHATILHLLGLDHEKLTYYHNGIDRRLTDVHGHVIKDILT